MKTLIKRFTLSFAYILGCFCRMAYAFDVFLEPYYQTHKGAFEEGLAQDEIIKNATPDYMA